MRTTTRLTSFPVVGAFHTFNASWNTLFHTRQEPLFPFDTANMGGSLCCILDFNKSLTIYMSIHNVFNVTC